MKAVFVNYNYTPDWLKDKNKEFRDLYDFDYLIYDRSEAYGWLYEFPKERIINTKNIGNADYDKLTYLIDSYDNLPEVFLWSKSNLFKYITRKEFEEVKNNKIFTPLLTQFHKVYEPICRYNNGIYEELNNSWYAPQLERKFNTYNDWADYMGLPKPEYLQFNPGGNFILTPKEVYKYPKEFYEKMRDTLNHAVLPAEAHYAERSYYALWK